MAQACELAAALVVQIADMDITVGFLMQIDKLVQLIESPIFIHVRLQLLEPAIYPFLIKSLYGWVFVYISVDSWFCYNRVRHSLI